MKFTSSYVYSHVQFHVYKCFIFYIFLYIHWVYTFFSTYEYVNSCVVENTVCLLKYILQILFIMYSYG
jgi:hypothetical protein